MNCNKCGTPILPGEHTCRFCGAVDDFSKRVPIEPKPEIIDFNIDDVEVVDFMIGEDEVTITPEPKEEPVNVDEIIDFSFDSMSTTEKEVVETTPIEPIAVPVVNSVIEEPATARIPVEEVKKILENESAPEIVETIEPVITEAIEEPLPEVEDKINAEPIKQEEKIIDEKVEEPKPKKENKNSRVGFIVVTMLLILSIILNCFLLMGKATNPQVSSSEVSEVSLTTVYDNYEIKLPNNWTVNSTNDKYVLIYDGTEDWAASIGFTSSSDFSLVKDNVATITERYGNSKYLFTSDYTKTINNKEIYVFKGKYYSYSVYLIISKVNDNTVAVTDLKFTGEVEENVLNSILNSLTTISVKDMSNFLKDNFEFKDTTEVLDNVIPKED